MDYTEIDEERRLWNERAKTIEGDIELRGHLKRGFDQLKKSIFQICSFFSQSENKEFLLDLGCGNGLFTNPVAGIFKFVVGIDISRNMIKRCKGKKENVDFIIASATDLPIKNHIFDAVLSLSLLQHLRTKKNVEKTLEEISRIAKGNSAIFITFWDTSNSPTKTVKETLKRGGYKLQQSLVSKFQFTGLQFTKYVKLKGCRTVGE